MRHILLPFLVVAICFASESEDVTSERIFLKYPSSFVNFTSDRWKLHESDNQIILAVNFQATSRVGQIFAVRFIHSNGSLEALLTVGISEGTLQIDLYNGRHEKILNKPMENVPINVHEHRLAVGINSTARNLWYKLAHSNDLNCEINQPINLSDTEVTVTVGGGGQSMIGCVTLLAVSAGSNPPGALGTPIAHQDIATCPEANECTKRDCNTGRCKLLEVPICDCYGTEMTGPNCRTPASTVQLRNNDENEETSAYLRYTPWQPDQLVSRIAMDFRFSDVDSKEGILVYGETDQKQIFKIYVVGTKGKMMLDEENIMDFDLRADDSQFHNIIVRFSNNTFHLYVDEVVKRRYFNATLRFVTIQFGAPIPTDVSEVGVTACVKNVYVDYHDIIDLMNTSTDKRVVSTKVRPCINEDIGIPGVEMFSADPVVFITPEPSQDDHVYPDPKIGNLFPSPGNKIKNPPTSCDKPNVFKCLNGAGCRKDSETEFTCSCKDGYIGKFCQFTTLPKTCAEAHDFLKLPNGATWVDVDGNGKLAPSVTNCVDGVTNIPHNMNSLTAVRDSGYPNHSLFMLNYRDFNIWQLARYMKNSGNCVQSVNYRCNKAPLKFKEGRTWFESVTNTTHKIRQIGVLENACPCLDSGCQSGGKCNCDSGAISEDNGELTGRNAGISKVVTLYDEADVNAKMEISDLKCGGYENEKSIRFFGQTELQVADWTGGSVDFQFRTSQVPASLVTVKGINGEAIIGVSLLDGHTVQVNHLEALKIIGSQNKLNDSEWHHVLIELSQGEIRVTVDAAHVLLEIRDIAVLNGFVALGADDGGLIGCVRNVIVNDTSINLHRLLAESGKDHKISTSCESHCTPGYCQNGAKCYEDFVTGAPFCRCAFPDVHSGVNCEVDMNKNSSVSFHGGYLKFDNLSTVLSAPVYFSFRTDKAEALLFFAHDQNNNFLQVHLSEEVNVTLTLNNLDIVSQCTVRAQPGSEFGDMRWIQVAISHDAKSSQLQVDDAACTIRASRVLSDLPIQSLHNAANSEIVRPPVGNAAPIRPDPYTFTFIGNVDTGSSTNGLFLLKPKYESPIPTFYGCIRGLLVDKTPIDMRGKAEKLATSESFDEFGPARVHVGCDFGCSSLSCSNGGHCSVAWTNTDPTATKTTCDCSRTSYFGANCTLDDGIHLEKNGFLDFNISHEMDRLLMDKTGKIPQLLKFAFSASVTEKDLLEDKMVVASVTFKDRKKLEIEINPNKTINVAVTYEHGKSEVLNFDGNFLDGYRHFVVIQTNLGSATAVMVDSLRQDFEFQRFQRNIDMFNAQNVRIGDVFSEAENYNKNGIEGCVSNFLIDYQRGAALSFTPIAYFANSAHQLSKLITSVGVTEGSCAHFEVPNSLPVYQNRVKFPIWDIALKRFIYHGEIESPENGGEDTDWTQEDSGSLMWIFFIIAVLVIMALIIFCIFMKCCRERIHHGETYPNDEDMPLNDMMLPSILRQPQPSPPPMKKSAASNYRIPNPNVDFNKETPYDEEEDEDDEGDTTIREQLDEDSDEDTIRHIDEDVNGGYEVVSRPTQVSHLPQRMSSFRSGDPTAPLDSPLYATPRKPAPPVYANVPVPPPRMSGN